MIKHEDLPALREALAQAIHDTGIRCQWDDHDQCEASPYRFTRLAYHDAQAGMLLGHPDVQALVAAPGLRG